MSEWWDDDPELLGATLGLLAAWEDETMSPEETTVDAVAFAPTSPSTLPSPSSPSPSSSDSSSSTAVAVCKRTRQGRNVNVSRERRKQELQFLRRKVDDMKRQLHELRARRDAQLQPHYLDAQRTQLATVAPVWESLATSQFRARKQSEMRNAKLRTLLSAQMRVAKDLMHAIQLAEQRTPAALPFMRPTLRLPIDVSQRMSEEDQLERLGHLRATWESEFARCDKFAPCGGGRGSGSLQFLDTRVVEDSCEGTMIELVSSSVLPYPVERVEEAMWNIYLEESGVDNDVEIFSQRATATTSQIIAVFSVATMLDTGERGTMQGKLVTRRFHPSATQAVMVFNTQAELQGYANKLDGVETCEDSWVRLVDASELGHTQLGGPLTVLQHKRRERIVVRERNGGNGNADATRSRVEMATRVVMNEIRSEIHWAQQTLENVLSAGGGHVTSETVYL